MKAKIMPALLGLPLLIATALGTDAQAASTKSYVLESSNGWGLAQDAAVAKAGGTITYSHVSGFATATSSNKNFAKDLKGVTAIEDMTVTWQQPIENIEFQSDAVNPADESFINAQWNHLAVDAPGAWALGYDGTGVRVAVLDGGIWNTHIDLVGQVDVAASTSFVPGFTFNQDVGTFWHGTHVAGIVAAADNAAGTVGLAPKATIVGVKVLHNGSGSFGQVISGILYAATPVAQGGGGADIINMSLGAAFARGGGNTGAGQLIGAMSKAINYAGSNNVLVVSSAGNSAYDLDHTSSLITVPAQAGSGIAVSSTAPTGYAVSWPAGGNDYDTPSSFTNYGNSAVWVAGPGGDFDLPGNALCSVPRVPGPLFLTTNCWVFDMVMSTVRGAGASTTTYGWAAGTSMAAPAVSAVAALIKQANPGISASGLKTKLAQSAVPGSGDTDYYGKGMVNAANAVQQ